MLRIIASCLLLLASTGAALAAAPNTLAYQGRLATSGGSPVTATLSITFRLYDVASGGVALWTETQPAVQVDGGNLAVELGAVTPLPTTIWGNKLYVGVQIAGDSEMAPRPALTAAPFALRARTTMKDTIVVSADGTALENGSALLASIAAVAGASATNPLTLQLDAGTFDLGTQRLEIPGYVTIAGQGQAATLITSAFGRGTLLLASNASARELTARNTGIPPLTSDNSFGIGAAEPTLNGILVENVTLENVTGESIAPSGSLGSRHGIYLCVENSHVSHVTGRGTGGEFSFGMRSDCPNSSGLFLNDVSLFSKDGSVGVRGAFFGGGGPWTGIRAFVNTNATAGTVFGLRFFESAIGSEAVLFDSLVVVDGATAPTVDSVIEAVRVDTAAIDFKGLLVRMNQVRGVTVHGMRIIALPGGPNPIHPVQVTGARIEIDGVQLAAIGPGAIKGIRIQNAVPSIEDTTIAVRCVAGGYNFCGGIEKFISGGPDQPGVVGVDRVRISVAHEDPADTSAQSVAFQSTSPARITNSTLRVLRSPDGEAQSLVNASAATADIRVSGSTLEVESTSTPTADCVAAGPAGQIELYGNYVKGSTCTSGAVATCAGNTKRGAGLLASTCP